MHNRAATVRERILSVTSHNRSLTERGSENR